MQFFSWFTVKVQQELLNQHFCLSFVISLWIIITYTMKPLQSMHSVRTLLLVTYAYWMANKQYESASYFAIVSIIDGTLEAEVSSVVLVQNWMIFLCFVFRKIMKMLKHHFTTWLKNFTIFTMWKSNRWRP